MFKGLIQNYTSVANSNTPLVVSMNTNDRTSYDSTQNVVNVLKSGYYNVSGAFNILIPTASTVTVQLYANGVAVAGTYATVTTTDASQNVNVSFDDVIKVVPNSSGSFANLSVQVSASGATVNGTLIVEYVR